MKYIREGRFGPQKSFKTGAVVGTYPKPMLVVSFDEAGLDVIPSRNVPIPSGYIQMDVVAEDIVKTDIAGFSAWLAKPAAEQPKVLCVDLADYNAPSVTLNYKVQGNATHMSDFVRLSDMLFQKRESLPWKTVVLDSVTGLTEIVIAHIASVDTAAMNDARKWAAQAGGKIMQTVAFFCSLSCHVVIIMHQRIVQDQVTGVILGIFPNIFGNAREVIGRLLSSFFYAQKKNGRPVLLTNDYGFIKGVGGRWPIGLPMECEPDFKSIYGKELLI